MHDTKTTQAIKHETFWRSVALTDGCQVAPPCLLGLLLFPDFPRGRASFYACAELSILNPSVNPPLFGFWVVVSRFRARSPRATAECPFIATPGNTRELYHLGPGVPEYIKFVELKP